MMKTYLQVWPEGIVWNALSTSEDKKELLKYIHQEGKDMGVVLYMRNGSFKHASYATINLCIDDAMAWSNFDIFKESKARLDKWKDEQDPLFKLTQAANIYCVNLEENASHVYDWYHKAHVYPDCVKTIDPKEFMNPPIRGLDINPAEFTDETANALYSLWIDFEDGFVYFICAKDSNMDRMVRDRIPSSENINLTKELTDLYNKNAGFRSCCNGIVKRLEEKE